MRSDAGVLETAAGRAVLDVSGQPITVPTGAVNIGPDGSISVTTPDGSAIAGQVGVYRISRGDRADCVGDQQV